MQANNPNNNDIFVRTNNSSIYDGLPTSFYSPTIFHHLGNENGKMNVNTNGKICKFHSVTLLPVNKMNQNVPMPTYHLAQEEPFQKHQNNKFIGFALDVKDKNKVKIVEKTQTDGWSFNNNIGLRNYDTIQLRSNGNITVRVPRHGQSNVAFMSEDLKSYSDKNNAFHQLRYNLPIKPIRSRSPLSLYKNGRMMHMHNSYASTTKGLPSLRGSMRLFDGAIEFPYNEYIMKGKNLNGAINTTALILDERKIHLMSNQMQQNIANDIYNYFLYTNQPIYKIDRRTKCLTQLQNLNEVKNTLRTIATAY